ncbi:hypothetical protein SAMN04489735_100374 [Aneurinibacillus thermoaerophilus]|uniref:Uncharacterized protein n=1 Tax=Aneurinibacillus thermoaerophilus TaxID=143495 RepID=A0A1G7X900_ANETH|nr:hypothetical protein SAMN04489735_100374 [Aneurinibacillus thermoaerophilus]
MACSFCLNSCCPGCRPANPVIFCPPSCPPPVRGEECNLLCELQVSESVPVTPPPTTQQPITSVTITTDQVGDRVYLEGTVEWAPAGLTTLPITVLPLSINLGVPGTFRIWRDAIGPAGVNVFEITDTSSLLNLTLSALVLPLTVTLAFNPTTTSFHFVDQNVPPGTHTYFLTVDVPPTSSGITTSAFVFTAEEINPNPPV